MTRTTARTLRETSLMTITSSLGVVERAYRAVADQAVSHVGVSQSMAWPLVMIGRHGDGMRQGVLADILNIEGPSLARSMDQLVQAGLVDRREDPTDRRAKTLHLTDAGAAACEQLEISLNAVRTEVFAGVPDNDIAAFLRVFTTLRERLGLLPVEAAPPAVGRKPPVKRP
jgi:MarR family transcriptional regulator for hemolysin